MQSFCSLNSLKYYNECRREKGRIGLYSLWLFGHFPLVVAITSVGVGLGHITSNAHELALTYSKQWLVCGSVALSLGGAQGILHLSSAYYYLYAGSTQDYRTSRKWATYRIISAGMILLNFAYPVVTIFACLYLAAICTAQIVLDSKQHPYHLRRRVLK